MAELRQVRLFKVELPAGLEADGVDDEVGVDMLAVRVGGHDDLVVLPLLCQLQCDLVRQLRRDRFLRMEGLDEVIVHPAAVFSVLQLGADELGAAGICLAVHAGHQMAVLIGGLFLLHHVLEHCAHAAAGLPAGTVDSCDDGHVSHRPLQQRLERTLDVGVEGTGLLDIHGGDASHVGQGGELVEVVALGFQGFCELRQRVDPDDLFADGAVGQILGEAHPARFRLAVDAPGVRLGHVKRQRNGFRSVGFLAQVDPPSLIFSKVGAGLPPAKRCRGQFAAACGGREQPKAMLALRRSSRCKAVGGGDPHPFASRVFRRFGGAVAALPPGTGNESRQAGKPLRGGAAAATGSMVTLFAAAGSSTPSALRRQMSRSPLLLRKDTVMPLRLRASTLLRIW